MFHRSPSLLYATLYEPTNWTRPKSLAPWVMMPVTLVDTSKSTWKRNQTERRLIKRKKKNQFRSMGTCQRCFILLTYSASFSYSYFYQQIYCKNTKSHDIEQWGEVHNLDSAEHEIASTAASETQSAPFGLIFNSFTVIWNNSQQGVLSSTHQQTFIDNQRSNYASLFRKVRKNSCVWEN